MQVVAVVKEVEGEEVVGDLCRKRLGRDPRRLWVFWGRTPSREVLAVASFVEAADGGL